MPRKLTAKQEKYKNNRIKGMGVSDSYRNAYPGQKMSNKAISVAANKLEKDPRISLALDKAKEKAKSKAIMTREEALERLSISARIKITDVATFKLVNIGTDELPIMQTVWTIKDCEDIDPVVAACIKSITMTSKGPKLELYDANGAIKQLATMEGWDAAKKYEHTGKGGGPVDVAYRINFVPVGKNGSN